MQTWPSPGASHHHPSAYLDGKYTFVIPVFKVHNPKGVALTHAFISPLPPNSPFLEIVHPEDRRALLSAFCRVILTMASPSAPIQCRLWHGMLSSYRSFDLSVRYGSQGLICTVWRSVIGCVDEGMSFIHVIACVVTLLTRDVVPDKAQFSVAKRLLVSVL